MKKLLYTLVFIVVLVFCVVGLEKIRWEYRRGHYSEYASDSVYARKRPQLKASSGQVKILPDRDYWGVIHLPAKDSTFNLKFNYDFGIRAIKIEDAQGIHYTYGFGGRVYDDEGKKHRCVDSLNLHCFTHQDNEYYEISKLSKRLFCAVKANPAKHPRIIFISFFGHFRHADLAIIQEGKR